MRPPMQSAALQQNEANKQQQHQQHHHSQQQHQQQQQQHIHQHQQQQASAIVVVNTTDLPNQQSHKAKFEQREILVENHLNFACSAAIPTTATAAAAAVTVSSLKLQQPVRNTQPTYQQQQQQHFVCNRKKREIEYVDGVNDDDGNDNNDDSIQLVDLSTSPPTPNATTNFVNRHTNVLRRTSTAYQQTKRSSVISDCQYSRSSSSSEDGSCSLSGGGGGSEKLFPHHHYLHASTFDDAAENFIINFPADSALHQQQQHQNDCIINLPLSETEPLLTNIEATVADTQRAIRLSKNSASLIFTKKELPPHKNKATTATRYYLPTTTTTTSNNNFTSNNRKTTGNIVDATTNKSGKLYHHHSLKSSNEYNCKQQTRHLPATYYHQQQRRSLQLNYNNNLVTTSTCSANNNYCCSSGGSAVIPCKIGAAGGAVLHKQHHHSGLTSPVATTTTAAATRKQHAYSWYAPVYSALEEELEQDSRDSSPIHNLANTKKHYSHHYQHRSGHNSSSVSDNEAVALLETRNQINIQAQLHAQQQHSNRDRDLSNNAQARRSNASVQPPTSLPLQHVVHSATTNGFSGVVGVGGGGSVDFTSAVPPNSYDVEGPLAGSLGLAGGPLPRRRRFENFLKSWLGLKPSSSGAGGGGGGSNGRNSNVSGNDAQSTRELPASPEITITRTPSDQNVSMREPSGRHHHERHHYHRCSNDKLTACSRQGSTSSLNVVQQKLWNMMRREGSAASLNHEKSQSIVQYTGLRKCETVLALTRQTNSLCSPVLGMGPGIVGGCSGDGGFGDDSNAMHLGSGIFSANGVEQIRPLNRLRNSVTSINGGTCSRCSSLLSLAASGSRYSLNIAASGGAGRFVSTSPDGSQQQSLTLSQFQQPLLQQQRNSSIVSSRKLSCSNSRNRDVDDINDNGNTSATTTTTAAATVGPNIIIARNSSSGNCSRKSSAGANSACSITPPSNMTTATLNSSITPSTATTSSSTPITPTIPAAIISTNTSAAASAHIKSIAAKVTTTTIAPIACNAGLLLDIPPSSPLPSQSSSTFAAPSTTSQSYPLTITSLLSMLPSDEERQVMAATAAPSLSSLSVSSSTASNTLKASLKQQQQQLLQQQLEQTPFEMFTCKLCLVDVESAGDATTLQQCSCQFCTECMKAYVDFEITEGAYEISCPDAQCPTQGTMNLPEIANLTTANLMKKHHRYRLNREIELDKSRTWCPRAGCETVCYVGDVSAVPHSDATPLASTSHNAAASLTVASSPTTVAGVNGHASAQLCPVLCPSCKDKFCSACKKAWHANVSCEENSRRLVADGGQDDIGIPFDNDLIKCCPMCAVPIEKDEGCAQMMCKRCKHVFCWYCLASLDDDFLLRHYDKGPCKNKLGHSRASVVWHRAQVIGIFAGFGILLLVASPLLLLAAPCIICCKCRSCSGGSKIEEHDGDLDEATALQS